MLKLKDVSNIVVFSFGFKFLCVTVVILWSFNFGKKSQNLGPERVRKLIRYIYFVWISLRFAECYFLTITLAAI